MFIDLYDHQKRAIEKLKTGSILQGGVGSGKSLTALAYFVTKECGGRLPSNNWAPMKIKQDLYVITTARKRDTKDWEREASSLVIENIVVDSWNNLHKYIHIKNAFFIFDEQRLVGSGKWVKNFLKISKNNKWILLTATPGDTWMDYIPVFIANGFYTNRTEFIRRHVVYRSFTKFPSIIRYLEIARLIRLRNSIIVPMRFIRKTISHAINIVCQYDKDKFRRVLKDRWNIFKNEPITNISDLCYTMRRVANSDSSRLDTLYDVYQKHNKVIVFYNFDYELNNIVDFCKCNDILYAQWNGHKHEEIPKAENYLYLLQYAAGSEAWNCIETNCILFFSQNYSYKTMIQSAGRIDRLNTPYIDLYYYHLLSQAPIDISIKKALKNKQKFNEHEYSF